MTRKDYVLIAESIKATSAMLVRQNGADFTQRRTIREITNNLAAALRDDNSAFQPSRFIAACGFE